MDFYFSEAVTANNVNVVDMFLDLDPDLGSHLVASGYALKTFLFSRRLFTFVGVLLT